MAIFSSYVKLPEGMINYGLMESSWLTYLPKKGWGPQGS